MNHTQPGFPLYAFIYLTRRMRLNTIQLHLKMNRGREFACVYFDFARD